MKACLVIIVLFGFIACQPGRHSAGKSKPLEATAVDTLVRDTLIKYKARPDLGFNFEYFIYLPKGLKKNNLSYLLVETTNTGLNDSIEYHERGARYAASRSSVGNYVARKLKVPLLVPIFPRPATQWQYYTHALDRETLLSKELGLERLDLQLLAMVADAKLQLKKESVVLKDKFLMAGFSASGTFANRFSILHPERLKATASGGINAIAILPQSTLNATDLNYPIGINDIKKITGKAVNIKAFANLPKLLFMGEMDVNDAVAFDDAYSKEERAFIYKHMGKEMIPQRWEFVKNIYLKNKVLADFRTYPKIGHGTDLKINNDVVNFFRQHLDD